MKLPSVDSGKAFDWGKVSDDYAKYRDIYPDAFYQKIRELGLCREGQTVLDLGTGTGVLPRYLSRYGARFVGVDVAENQIAQARRLSEGLDIEYVVSPVEAIDFPDATFDAALACQCFLYFNRDVLLPRLYRMLKPEGKFLILSMIWLPFESPIAARSEEIALTYNPSWNGAGFTRPAIDYERFNGTPFQVERAFSFDVPVSFTRASWHGRIKASRVIGASVLSAERIAAFEKDHLRYLQTQPEAFDITHAATFYLLKKRAP